MITNETKLVKIWRKSQILWKDALFTDKNNFTENVTAVKS